MNWKHIAAILTGTALPALITALAGHPLTWATFAQALGAAITVTVAVYLQKPGALLPLLLVAVFAAGACTPTERRTADTITSAIGVPGCDVALSFADPALAPLCTDLPTLVAMVEHFFPEGAASLEGGDAGEALARATAALAVSPSMSQQVHDWLIQHGAVPLGG